MLVLTRSCVFMDLSPQARSKAPVYIPKMHWQHDMTFSFCLPVTTSQLEEGPSCVRFCVSSWRSRSGDAHQRCWFPVSWISSTYLLFSLYSFSSKRSSAPSKFLLTTTLPSQLEPARSASFVGAWRLPISEFTRRSIQSFMPLHGPVAVALRRSNQSIFPLHPLCPRQLYTQSLPLMRITTVADSPED